LIAHLVETGRLTSEDVEAAKRLLAESEKEHTKEPSKE
jgi:hypothetical protein